MLFFLQSTHLTEEEEEDEKKETHLQKKQNKCIEYLFLLCEKRRIKKKESIII